MSIVRPIDGETVWVEFPAGKHFEAEFGAKTDTFTPKHGPPIAAKEVVNWVTAGAREYRHQRRP